MEPGYCTTPGSNVVSDTIRSLYCGVATVFSVPADTFGGAVSTGAEAVTTVADTAGETVQTAFNNAAEVASPLNLAGAFLGLSVGGIGATVVVAGLGAFAVDQLVFAGAGTSSLARRMGRRR